MSTFTNTPVKGCGATKDPNTPECEYTVKHVAPWGTYAYLRIDGTTQQCSASCGSDGAWLLDGEPVYFNDVQQPRNPAPKHVPQVGDGATEHVGSDCYPCTVIAVSKSGLTVTVQRDSYRCVSGSGHDGSAEYEYERDPNGATYKVRWTTKGWCDRGIKFGMGGRRYYYDPHF